MVRAYDAYIQRQQQRDYQRLRLSGVSMQRASRQTPLLVRTTGPTCNGNRQGTGVLERLDTARAADRKALHSAHEQLQSKGQQAAALEQALEARCERCHQLGH